MDFIKMHGCANDFIVTTVDTQEQSDALQPFARQLCERHTNIGADGVVVVMPSQSADLRMRIFNADGSEAEMCGNGVRCAFRYARTKGLTTTDRVAFETLAGSIVTEADGDQVRVDMGAPVLEPELIPVAEGTGSFVQKKLDINGRGFEVTAVSMGNPHAVVYVDELTDELVLGVGPLIEDHPFFPKHTNVEFITVQSPAEINMRVYERGCGETLACGTGACAATVSGILNELHGNEVTVHLLGGDLRIAWDGVRGHSVLMTGPAVSVCSGSVALQM